MELTQHGFLEELLAPRREPWNTTSTTTSTTTFGGGVSDLLQSGWSFDGFDENPEMLLASNTSFLGLISSQTDPSPTFDCCPFPEPYPSFLDSFSAPPPGHQIDDSALPFHQEHSYPSMVEGEVEDPSAEVSGFLHHHHPHGLEDHTMTTTTTNNGCCKVEVEQSSGGDMVVPLKFNMGLCNGETKKMNSKAKKLDGQPSKNLMAERRRRKRLNDRLSMLRSIVPKISKMDRTSILGDTIDYMKELLERINKLQEEEESEVGTNQMNLAGKQNEAMFRNSPKFDVERRETGTKIDICCPTRPGLLLSTVNTLEALGIEIQQCVISCFSDFSMHASCSEAEEQKPMLNSEDIKQALFRNAGYGGRCL